MVVNFILLFIIYLPFGNMVRHEAPIPEKVWSQRCYKGEMVLNNCNWCRCSDSNAFVCDTKVCNQVDLFGHFNDAIQDIDVGMEGHGVWRSRDTFCKPGVQYKRGELLCICTEEGYWPNPTCRDTLGILYSVEEIKDLKPRDTCSPSKLYLLNCKVCLCPLDGWIDTKLCTNKNLCKKDFDEEAAEVSVKTEIAEIYAQCNPIKKYSLGCKNCICLRNNRLLCDNCTESSNCRGRAVGEPFDIDCNTCHCDDKDMMFCTVKRCLPYEKQDKVNITNFELAIRPDLDIDCTTGTKYYKDCNICFCYEQDGVKKFTCSLKRCSSTNEIKDCVHSSTYAVDCLLCQCNIHKGIKMETCQADPTCFDKSKQLNSELEDFFSLNGYCEPLHVYKKDCNTCQCLQDGKTVKCTSKECSDDSIEVDLIPVKQELTQCPKGHSYKIDCNYCFCLDNGNALCTTKSCNQ